MANSSFETSMKGAGQAADEAAKETGRAYDSASEIAQDGLARVQDTASDLDEIVTEQVGRHPKAMVALSVGIGFALGILFASTFRAEREPPWYDRIRS